jgi:hypothetical protein
MFLDTYAETIEKALNPKVGPNSPRPGLRSSNVFPRFFWEQGKGL